MSFQELFNAFSDDTVRSLRSFLPELTICATIVLLLVTRLCDSCRRLNACWISLTGAALAFCFATAHMAQVGAFSGWMAPVSASQPEIFTGLLIYDPLTVFFREFLLLFAVLFILFTHLTGIPDHEDGTDFYTLFLGATLGMCVMASANHLLMVFLGVEMASVPSYALAGLAKGRRQSSEAALKYAVYGAGAAGIMLYGISLLAGVLGTAHLPTMARELAHLFASGQAAGMTTALTLGGLMVAVGLAFKLSAVPFHFWCPDVFEGATAEVNAFLSVASKAAALALLIRIVVGLGQVSGPSPELAAAEPVPAAQAASDAPQHAVLPVTKTAETASLLPVRRFMLGLLCLLSAVTCTFGNLAAYGQTNIKRLLAYSTIAHAGYLMMPVAALTVLMGKNSYEAGRAVAAVCFYLGVYLFMNLGAFAIVAFLRNRLRSEQISDYAGLIRRMPGLVICFAAILLSLLGLPPLAGFPAKIVIFSSLIQAAQADPAAWTEMIALLVIGGLNTAISLFYYLRVVKVMIIDPEPADRLPVEFPFVSVNGAFLAAITLPVFVLGVWFNGLFVLARHAAERLFS